MADRLSKMDMFKNAVNKLKAAKQSGVNELIGDVKDLRKEQFNDEMNKEKNAAFKDRMNNEEWNRMLKRGKNTDVPDPYEEEPVDVPEIESQVVDLPEEEPEEKEIVVDHNPDETIIAEDDIPKEDGIDTSALSNEDLNVVDPDYEGEETSVSDTEVNNGFTPSTDEPSIPSEPEKPTEPEKKEEPSAEENKTEESAENKDEKKDKDKDEDKRLTPGLEEPNGNRYSTAVKIGEDLIGLGEYGVDTAKDLLTRDRSGVSVNDAVERAKSVPHYSYTQMFGR